MIFCFFKKSHTVLNLLSTVVDGGYSLVFGFKLKLYAKALIGPKVLLIWPPVCLEQFDDEPYHEYKIILIF